MAVPPLLTQNSTLERLRPLAERFIRTLKEQLLWVRSFDTAGELRLAQLEFKERFNRHWLLKRHGYKTPAEVRAQYEPAREVA